MTTLMASLRNSFLLMIFFLNTSCSATNTRSEFVLVGSTPGDEAIKSMLSISEDTKVDFIRWDLKFDNNNAFVLIITYGESQPNTLDFKDDGQKQTIKGSYLIAKDQQQNRFKEVYQLKSDDLPENISLVKLNENLFHILTAQNHLMVGNGGWSYSLNRKNPVNAGKILISSAPSNDQSLQLVFDGRTPCQEMAAEHPEMNVSPSCFKLKWRLTLNRDSLTFLPTTCTIRKVVDNQPRDVTGKWRIINGTATNPDAIIYKIEFDESSESFSLFVGDEDVLFFLDKNNEPLSGNEDFSFSLNKKDLRNL